MCYSKYVQRLCERCHRPYGSEIPAGLTRCRYYLNGERTSACPPYGTPYKEVDRIYDGICGSRRCHAEKEARQDDEARRRHNGGRR